MSSPYTTISEKLRETEQLFSKAGIPSPRLDAEVLLAYTLGVTRPYLHAHATDTLQGVTLQQMNKLVERRLQREPVAYITGEKEFYGRKFIVTPDVLIPRPETEDLVDLALDIIPKGQTFRIVEVGTGSGCIGITLKLERPELDVTLSDISSEALGVAKKNAKQLGTDVRFVESDLLSSFILHPSSFSLIVANLPYVDKTWKTSPETAHEPALALYADDNGLRLIYALIESPRTVLGDGGWLLLEADPEQHEDIIAFAAQHDFKHVETSGYALSFTKQTQASQ